MVGAVAPLLDRSDVSLGVAGRRTLLIKPRDPHHTPLDRS
ncbi:MAG: hypothetical protein OJF50_006149 [Nitrospira sp.]|nr:hypothetical protein [Nitrospira sp.]